MLELLHKFNFTTQESENLVKYGWLTLDSFGKLSIKIKQEKILNWAKITLSMVKCPHTTCKGYFEVFY